MKGAASAVLVVLLGTAIAAHHSHPEFLLDQDATVEGTIDRIEFKNPHTVLTIVTTENTLYTLEWQGAAYLDGRQRFYDFGTARWLKVGDVIVVTGSPAADPARHELVNLKDVFRPRDGWRWTCRRADQRDWC